MKIITLFISLGMLIFSDPSFVQKRSYFTSSAHHQIIETNEGQIEKIYTLPEDLVLFEQDQKALAFAEELSLPTPSITSVSKYSIVMEKAKGISLDTFLGGKPSEEKLQKAMKDIAFGLAQLHKVTTPFSSPIKSYSDRTLIKDFIQSNHEEKLLPYLLALKASHVARKGLVHKDLHPGNIFIDGERATLIDLTTLQSGDTTYDVALFLSHYRAVSTYYGISPELQKKGEKAFLEEYRRLIPLHEKDLAYPMQMVAIELIDDYAEIPELSEWAQKNLKDLSGMV